MMRSVILFCAFMVESVIGPTNLSANFFLFRFLFCRVLGRVVSLVCHMFFFFCFQLACPLEKYSAAAKQLLPVGSYHSSIIAIYLSMFIDLKRIRTFGGACSFFFRVLCFVSCVCFCRL